MLTKLIDFKENKASGDDTEKLEGISKKDIAIIGLAGKFDPARDLDEYWE